MNQSDGMNQGILIPESSSLHGRDIALAVLSHVPVLVTAPTSNERRLCARLIHDSRATESRPFVAVSCSAGVQHEQAWDDVAAHDSETAASVLAAWFAKARGGTLFVDGLEGMSIELQQRLSSALDHALDGTGESTQDIRLITGAAANWPSGAGRRDFCERLFYRLNIVRVDWNNQPDLDVLPAPLSGHLTPLTHDIGLAPQQLRSGMCDASHTAKGQQ